MSLWFAYLLVAGIAGAFYFVYAFAREGATMTEALGAGVAGFVCWSVLGGVAGLVVLELVKLVV